ncbi:MAG: hypothetical protein LBF40_08610 [Deltaproteobacteria bacterium]|nr:hypothetical protein [Deltaproteobacteria bacterium]
MAYLVLCILLQAAFAGLSGASPASSKFGDYTLTQVRLGPGLWYFQISEKAVPLSATLSVSPMLADPGQIDTEGYAQGTPFPVIQLNGLPTVTVRDDDGNVIFSFSAFSPEGRLAGLTIHGESYTHVVGLGASFGFTSSNINYVGKVFDPSGNTFGTTFEKGDRDRQELDHASGLQAPICFALGPERQTAAVFVNETRPLFWDFSSYPWTVTLKGPLPPSGAIGFFVLTGEDLPAVRRLYMTLVGRAPPPPSSIYYPWILDTSVSVPPKEQAATDHFTAVRARFPEFKGIGYVYTNLNASLPHAQARALGVELLVSESPYVPVTSPHFQELSKRGFLVKGYNGDGAPLTLKYNNIPSALLDYTNPAAATYWHNLTRQETVAAGGTVFYLTGGEPEVYSPFAWYRGVGDPSSHSHYAWANRFSFKWIDAMRQAMKSPLSFFPRADDSFILARAGLGGMGRLGAALFTVDPHLAFPLVASQARAHLNLSGIDYYTTDVTPLLGFFRLDIAEPIYESWFSRNGLLNLPLMVPDSFADLPWAKQVLRQKARFEPYYFSLSHHIALSGDPMISPLLYYFQEDMQARNRSYEFMLGPDLLVVAGSLPGAETVEFYLPAGSWWSVFDEETITLEEGSLVSLPAKHDGMQLSPILLKSGAIIPTWDNPADPKGLPSVLVFPGEGQSSFLWYEKSSNINQPVDETGDQVNVTTLTLTPLSGDAGVLHFSIKTDQTHFDRAYILEFVGIGNVRTVTLDGDLYDRVPSLYDLRNQESGWCTTTNGKLVFKTPPVSVDKEHVLLVR